MSGGHGPILPGSTLGILGGGQLGRMFTLAAKRMGYRVHVLSPEPDSPTGQVADRQHLAEYDDPDALEIFAREVAAVSFEFENVPTIAASELARHVPVRPADNVLHLAQNRLREKTAIGEAGVPTVTWASVTDEASLDAAVAAVKTPAILKTASSGYDGKGQVRIERAEDAAAAFEAIGRRPAVLEAVASFVSEVSVVAARGDDGALELFEPTENVHVDHILDVSTAPATLSPEARESALQITRTLMEAWDVVGVLCVEMFHLEDGSLVVNEVAPRPHNSGHLTIEYAETSQFEQQVRALCGLPLGSTLPRAAGGAMTNLLGDLWQDGEPDWAAALAEPAYLHLYGKTEPRVGRKMGHVTALGASVDEARERAARARAVLTAKVGARR